MMVHRNVPPLVWFVLLFIGTRLLYLLFIHPDNFFTVSLEELYRGTIAMELVSGLHMPFIDYRADDFSGGSLVVGAIASCFFRLFGPTVFALKLTPLVLYTLALVCWYLTIERQLGQRIAGYFAVIFSLSPPIFTAASLTTVGFHTESVFFTALSVWLFFKMLSKDHCPLYYSALLGLTAGFGLWFAYIYGITLLVMLVFWWWHDRGRLLSPRFAAFALGFVAGFSPWIFINVENDFSGLMVHRRYLWNHFGPHNLARALSDFRFWFPYQFLATLASDSPANLERRVMNASYALLYLIPVLAYCLLSARTWGTTSGKNQRDQFKLAGFSILYLCLFAIAVQLSDFKASRYNIVAYPFVFLFLASSIVRLQDAFPLFKKTIRSLFLSSVTLLWVTTHTVLFSLDGVGYAFSAKGYSYGHFLDVRVCRMCDSDDELLAELEQRSYLPSMIQQLSPEDRRLMSISLVQWLADAVPFNKEPVNFARLQRLIPPGFEKQFYYHLGLTAASPHANDLAKALQAVEFVRARSAPFYHLALIGVLDEWGKSKTRPELWPTEPSPESLLAHAVAVPPELVPFYWRAFGSYVARFWYGPLHSLENVKAQLTAFAPRLDPTVQRYVLQGIGQFLFSRWEARPVFELPFAPVELERFPRQFHQGLFEGVGMGLSKFQLFSWVAWQSKQEIVWNTTTADLSPVNVSSIRDGWNEFSAIFERSETPLPSTASPSSSFGPR